MAEQTIQNKQKMLKVNPEVRRCNNLSDLEKLEEGDVVMLASSNMAKVMRGVYEGVIDGKEAFIRGEFNNGILSWRCPREKINYVKGAVVLDQNNIAIESYVPGSDDYRIKKAMILLAKI